MTIQFTADLVEELLAVAGDVAGIRYPGRVELRISVRPPDHPHTGWSVVLAQPDGTSLPGTPMALSTDPVGALRSFIALAARDQGDLRGSTP